MNEERVLLLHGMGRTAFSMLWLSRWLTRQGFTTQAPSYPSRRFGIAALGDQWLGPRLDRLLENDERPLHIVTHSLGGLLTRRALATRRLPPGSRVVMLAPPNQGSEVSDLLGRWPLARWLAGRPLAELGTGPDGMAQRLAPIEAEIGIIAATRSLDPLFGPLFKGPHDGKVAVARTRLAEPHDFATVASNHTFVMNHPETRRLILNFLRSGRFAGR